LGYPHRRRRHRPLRPHGVGPRGRDDELHLDPGVRPGCLRHPLRRVAVPANPELGRLAQRRVRRGQREGAGPRPHARPLPHPRGGGPVRPAPGGPRGALHLPPREPSLRVAGGADRRCRGPRQPERPDHVASLLLDRRLDDASPRRVRGAPRRGAPSRQRSFPRSAVYRRNHAAGHRSGPAPVLPRRPRSGGFNLHTISRGPRRRRDLRLPSALRPDPGLAIAAATPARRATGSPCSRKRSFILALSRKTSAVCTSVPGIPKCARA